MIKIQDTIKFAYDITVCIHNMIPTASDIMIKVQNTMTFVYDILVCIHNIIATASHLIMKAYDTMMSRHNSTKAVTRRQ